jgi:VanZ family protein
VRQTRRRWTLRITWLLMLVCVVTISLVPSHSAAKRAMDALNVSDKLLHFLAYFMLMSLPTLHERRLATPLLAVGLVSLGVLLEFAELLVPGRSCELGDMLANAAGVLVGLAAGAWLRRTGHLTMRGEGA